MHDDLLEVMLDIATPAYDILRNGYIRHVFLNVKISYLWFLTSDSADVLRRTRQIETGLSWHEFRRADFIKIMGKK